jgi:D-sedoheptulose 7-phosphate isomerase
MKIASREQSEGKRSGLEVKSLPIIKSRIVQSISNLRTLLSDSSVLSKISVAAEVIIDAIGSGNKLMICGNGGSAADAQHIAGELVCRFYRDREPVSAIALSTDTSVLTAVANDYSYECVYSRQVKALGKSGDILLGISTSGNSRNVLEALKIAQQLGIRTILITGKSDRDIASYSNIVINVPSADAPRIQEMHLLIEHLICEIVEKELFNLG